MLFSCLKCRKRQKVISLKLQGQIKEKYFLSKFAVGKSKKSRSIKKQEAEGLLNNLELKTALSRIPAACDILF